MCVRILREWEGKEGERRERRMRMREGKRGKGKEQNESAITLQSNYSREIKAYVYTKTYIGMFTSSL